MKEITLDILMLRDKTYFRNHPDCKQYIREYIPGEFYGIILSKEFNAVEVTKISDDARIRRPIVLDEEVFNGTG